MTTKLCKSCNRIKSVEEFGILNSTKDGRNTKCKPCKQKTEKAYFHNNERARLKRAVDNRKWKYGLTPEEYELKLKNQNYCCAICNIHLDKSSLHTTGHVDHNHTTNKVRGVLCKACNNGLGHFYENQDALLNAVQYLRKYN